ncbi:MAG: hypothetical protein ACOYJE_09735 [Bacteroidaceae bacterium]|jgi:hypothetical protein
MRNFETQLHDSAARLRESCGARRRPLPPNPRRPLVRRMNWLAIPAAAVLGWLVGAGMPFWREQPSSLEMLAMDTVKEWCVVRDTLYLPAAEPLPLAEKTRQKRSVAARRAEQSGSGQSRQGRSIQNDGIDYSLIVALP